MQHVDIPQRPTRHVDSRIPPKDVAGFKGGILGSRDESAAPYGFCTLDCEGYCPDRSGYAGTFCVSLLPGAGTCVAKAAGENGQCSGIPGTVAKAMPRWVGQSGAPAATATVCVPR